MGARAKSQDFIVSNNKVYSSNHAKKIAKSRMKKKGHKRYKSTGKNLQLGNLQSIINRE